MIRLAVVGAGHWGPNLISNFYHSERSEVRYVLDLDPARCAAVRSRFPQVETPAELSTVLDDDDLDALVISTPTRSHFDLARRALEAGKHVLVEKPLTTSSPTSLELCRLAERTECVLMVGHVFVYNEAARLVKQYVERGDLGRIYYLSMVRTNLGPIRVDVDAGWDLAAHDIALASYWLNSWPISATASGGEFINAGIADVIFATLSYPNGVLVHLHASWLNPRKTRDITLVGDRQMLTFDDTQVETPIRIYDKQVLQERTQPGFVDSYSQFRMSVQEGEVSEPEVVPNEPLRSECDHFLDCIEHGTKPLSGGVEGLAVVRVLEAMSRSLELGGQQVSVEFS